MLIARSALRSVLALWVGIAAFVAAFVLASPAHARTEQSWVQIGDLDGVSAQVAALEDPAESMEWEMVRHSALFAPVGSGRAAVPRATGMWYRIDLAVPDKRLGTTAWLRVTPALIWKLQWHDDLGRSGVSGMSVPMSSQQYPASPSIIQVKLNRPQIRLFVRVLSAAPELTHMALLSDSALQAEVRRNTMVQALFLGAVGLMLVLTLLNWAYTRSSLHKLFALYLGTTVLFVQCVNGGINHFVLPENPLWMARLSFASFMWAIAATIAFSLVALNIEQNFPRLTRPFRVLAVVIFCASVLGLRTEWIASVSAVMWPFHLIFGTFLLGLSVHQALKWRTPQSLVVCAAYLCFNIFEKFPLMTMLGWFPVQAWTSDVANIGLISQMLLTQLQLALRLREQQDLQRRALAAHLEAQAERAQKRDLLQFLGMFGHEVRTPLAIIHAATESLEMLPGAQNKANRERHLRIRSAVERLSILAREALSRERIEASGWTPTFRSVDMAVLIEDVLWWQQIEPPGRSGARAEQRYCMPCMVGGRAGGQLCIEIDESLPDVQADPDMLHMAVTNLLDNARKYGSAASEVRLQVYSLKSRVGQADRCVIDISSQGVELTEQERQRMFDKYWRRAEHRNIPGAGMGLHLVKTVVQAHHASIEVHSLLHGWTRFRIELPLRQPSPLV